MGMWDSIADRHFAKDDGGKLVFLPRGRRRPAYFVDSTDENKIKSVVKLYIVAAAFINLTGTMATIAFTGWLVLSERSAPLAYKLKFGAVVWAIAATLFYLGPAISLWNIYRRAVDGICASLTVVDWGAGSPDAFEFAPRVAYSLLAGNVLQEEGLHRSSKMRTRKPFVHSTVSVRGVVCFVLPRAWPSR